MQATHRSGALAGEVVTTIGQHAQDDGLVVGHHGIQASVAERGDRSGQGVIGVVLLRAPGAEHPHACRQGRWHVDDVLAGGDELLGQQAAQAPGGLDGPPPLREALGPRQQLVALSARGLHPDGAKRYFIVVDGHGRV